MREGYPEQRPVSARILTPRGWIRGTFHPPRVTHLVDFLNHAGHFVTVTDVTAEAGQGTLEYLSLSRDAMSLVVLEDTVSVEPVSMATQPVRRHRIYALLAEGSLTGGLDVGTQVRVSDFFVHRSGFVLLHDVELRTPGLESPGPWPTVLLHAQRAIGVAELAAR
ncbi:MAG TPA: hypothetical protein RMH99_09915 [Sandaracinaceae bacterium LLY-WYZ-13_1]|nr:hypothetical protein [Sandaracinaceae bacterium LLY-WYZ-13_1]